MIHFIELHLRSPTFIRTKKEIDFMFYLSDEHVLDDVKLINLMEWLHTISSEEIPMNRMMHCDTAIEAILEILDKPSLNSFHRKKSC
jgi:phage host-nuclease inhibitor protein Gam